MKRNNDFDIFLKSGKIEDYLKYRSRKKDKENNAATRGNNPKID